MRREDKKRRNGFTVGEFLVGAVLVVVVAAVAYNAYLFGQDAFIYTTQESRMHLKAMYVIERMIYGVGQDHKGLQEAQDVTLAAGAEASSITFTAGDNAAETRRFFAANNEITYRNESSVDRRLDVDNEVDNDVQALTFRRSATQPDLINIDLTLSKTLTGTTVTVSISTSVRLRNI